MNMMDIARKAQILSEQVQHHEKASGGGVRAKHVAELAHLVAELASSASSATDPRLWDQS
jgi:hypothetical protein